MKTASKLKPEMEKATIDVFEKCTPAQRMDAFGFIVVLVSARDKKMIFHAPDKEIKLHDFLTAFSACTFDEKLQVIFFIIGQWTADFQELLRSCKADHARLDSLPLASLRELAGYEHGQAHKTIVTLFPTRADLLRASACLANFSVATNEPTSKNLRDVKENVILLWSLPDSDHIDTEWEVSTKDQLKQLNAKRKVSKITTAPPITKGKQQKRASVTAETISAAPA